jgi:hypothetical protein
LSAVILFLEWWSVWLDGDKVDFYGPVLCVKDDRKNCFIVFVGIIKIIAILTMFVGIIIALAQFYI